MIEPKRYHKQSIDLKLFQDFFIECGDYKMNNLDNAASPIWTECYENHDENVFESIQKKSLDNLKNLYENYYMNGLSDGATSGKALEDKEKRDSKSKRNLLRSKPLAVHLKMVEQNQDLDIGKFYSELYKKYTIPKTITQKTNPH